MASLGENTEKTSKPEGGELPRRDVSRWPDFFVIGASKSGTTTLHDYLRRHPALWMSTPKEPRYFDQGFRPDRRDPKVYRGLFAGAAKGQLCGESSVDYSAWPRSPGVPRAIHAVIPNARFIYLLREPLARCYSHFRHLHERHNPSQPYRMTFEESLENNPVIADASDYAAQIQQYLEYFPKSSILLLPFERFAKEPAWALQRIFAFLGVGDLSEDATSSPIHSNSTNQINRNLLRSGLLSPFRRVPGLRPMYRLLPTPLREKSVELFERSYFGQRRQDRLKPPPMLPATRERLRERFGASTEYLVREFDFDTSWWASERA